MIARVRQYRTAEEAIKEWTRLGLDMPERAFELLPETAALFVEGGAEELDLLLEAAAAENISASMSEKGHHPRFCVVGDVDEVEALDAVLKSDMISSAIERYRSDGAPPMPIPRGKLSFERPLVMGILNMTPDSFSDGGSHKTLEDGERAALAMVEEGVDIIDVGGESTRPGASAVPVDVELARTIPVISRIAGQTNVPISIDTRKPEVARAAVEAGASIINDVSGLGDRRMSQVAAELKVPVVLMHSLSDPLTMQRDVNEATYDDVVSDIMWSWEERMQMAEKAGLDRSRIILDPGIGFGKLPHHNLEIIDRARELRCSGRPTLLGASRKGFIGRITGEAPDQRLGGSLAAAAVAVMNGASVVRVHDVRETVSLVRTIEAIRALRI